MTGHFELSVISITTTFFLLVSTLLAVQACEKECISGVTNAFKGNYSVPVQLAILSLADEINTQLIPDNVHPSATYLDPLLSAFGDQVYSTMEKAIFPSYFHGKCQDSVTGVTPPGCPNPDCPVVCGTPGSMVHFFPRLRYIAFNSTVHLLRELTRTGSPAFRQIQTIVESIRNGNRRRQMSLYKRDAWHPRFPGGLVSLAKRDNYVKDSLERIFQDIRSILEKICGGTGDGTTNGLPYCSWEQDMKEYILTFP